MEGREASLSAGVLRKAAEFRAIKRARRSSTQASYRRRYARMVGLHSAFIQDRDGAPAVLKTILEHWPWLRHIFADGGYAGPQLKGALQKIAAFTLQIVWPTDKARGFKVLPRRWVVKRTFAWRGRCRGLAKDWEKSVASAEAWVTIAHIRVLTRRLARVLILFKHFRGRLLVKR